MIGSVRKGSELAWCVRGGGGGWQGACAAANIFMEKAIKLCSLINGHHQDLFPAQIKLNVMALLANALSSFVNFSRFPDPFVPQLVHLGYGIKPGDEGIGRIAGP